MKRLLKVKFAWFPVWAVASMMMMMISIYLPVFGGATQRLTDFSLVVVNEDEQFAQSESGKQLMEQLLASNSAGKLQWVEKTSRQKAVDYIKDDKAFGAIVIPADFSSRIAGVQKALQAGKAEADTADLEILINEGAGQLPTSVASSTLQQTAASITAGVVAQLTESLTASGTELSPAAAALLANPITTASVNVLGLPADVNKGMTPFMLVLICSISGLMGTQMIHGYVSKIGERIRERGVKLAHTTVMLTEYLLGMILCVGIAALLQLFVLGIFGASHSTGVGKIFGFTLLCILTMFFFFKALGLLFGKWAMLVMFPINILGIFASGGAVALTGLPKFHQMVSLFIPTRYMVDGFRSLFYFNGNMESGLELALIVILTYLAVFFIICLILFFNTYRKDLAEGASETLTSGSGDSGGAAASA